MPNIYNLPQEVENALEAYYACFDPETGELQVAEDELVAIQGILEEMQNQSDEILQWYLQDHANRIARADMLNAEIQRIAMQLAKESKQVNRSEMLIGRVFERIYQGKPLNIGTFTLSYRKSEAVLIEDESKIPKKFMNKPEPPKPKPDKNAIKEALKSGIKVRGASIETRNNLQIK